MKQKLLITLLFVAGVAALGYWRFFSAPFITGTTPKLFEVQEGETAHAIADKLKKEELIRSTSAFLFMARLKNLDKELRPGRYQLQGELNLKQILRVLTDPNRPQISITIPEGFSVREIDEELVSIGLIQPGDFLAQARTLEGYLFPDTYFVFSRNFRPEDLSKKMQENFLAKITADQLEAIKKSGQTLPEIITMASMLEKEVKTEKDAPVVAGILWKRIASGWPLQADATLLYGRSANIISERELQDETNPYNTYKKKGLPPTPIGNPGLKTIRAAIFPEDSPYWFYLSDRDGNIHYARTNEEQNENRRKYL